MHKQLTNLWNFVERSDRSLHQIDIPLPILRILDHLVDFRGHFADVSKAAKACLDDPAYSEKEQTQKSLTDNLVKMILRILRRCLVSAS